MTSIHCTCLRLALALLCCAAALPAAGATWSEFPLPTGASLPQDITLGPDGNLWFTERGADQIGRITPDGVVSEFPVPGSGSEPVGIVAGPDGNLWFTQYGGNQIGRISTTGSVTEFAIPTAGVGPYAIAVGNDGNLWFTGRDAALVGWVGLDGSIGEVALLGAASPISIVAPPLGWDATGGSEVGTFVFSTTGGESLRSYVSSGSTFTRTPLAAGGDARGVAANVDGSVWVALGATDEVVRFGTGLFGAQRTLRLPTSPATPTRLAPAPDGSVWATLHSGNRLARISAHGGIDEFEIPFAGAQPFGVVVAPDGSIWFTAEGRDSIGRLVLDATHDVHLPLAKPERMKIKFGAATARKKLKLAVRNVGAAEVTLELHLSNGTCPASLIDAGPDFDAKTVGVQSSVRLAAGKKAKAVAILTASAAETHAPSGLGAARCSLEAVARLRAPSGAVDATPANNHLSITVDVVDLNDL